MTTPPTNKNAPTPTSRYHPDTLSGGGTAPTTHNTKTPTLGHHLNTQNKPETNNNTKRQKHTSNQSKTPKLKSSHHNKKTQQLSKIMFWNKGNAKFLNRKVEITSIIEKYNPIIFGILEANLSPNHHKPATTITDYNIEIDNLIDSKTQARTVIYISNQIIYKRRKDLEPKVTPLIWIEINPKTKDTWLVSIGYREWESQVKNRTNGSRDIKDQQERLQEWTNMWEKANLENKPILIAGDLNIEVKHWFEPNTQLTSYLKAQKNLLNQLKEATTTHSLDLIQTKPTRQQGKDPEATIDLVLTNKPERITNVTLTPSCSDHQIISITINHTKPIPTKKARRSRTYKNYTAESMRKEMQTFNLDTTLWLDDPEQVAEILTTTINLALDKLAPHKTINPRKNYAPHLTQETKNLMKERDQKKADYIKSKNPEKREEYRILRNKAVKAQTKNKQEWAENLFKKGITDSKQLWRAVKTINGDNTRESINMLVKDGMIIKKNTDMANHLNNSFINKVKNLTQKIPKTAENKLEELKRTPAINIEQGDLYSINEKTLERIVKELKNSNASGPDSINSATIKDIMPEIGKALLHMINLSLGLGIFPKILKKAKIIPILKPGKEPTEAGSYRPISNLNILAKILEKAGWEQVMKHINNNNLINKKHHGGRKGHSTNTCLLEMSEKIEKSQDKKEKTAVLALDLSAAYDLIDHNLLFEKLRILSLAPHTTKWLRSFLSQRKQAVELEGKMSDYKDMGEMGVIQGGMSSGDLFTIFLNNLPNQTTAKCPKNQTEKSWAYQYIDDINIVISAPNNTTLQERAQQEYENMERYLTTNKMVINGNKSQLMIIGKDKEEKLVTITAGGTLIKHQDNLKTLGITFSSNGTFTKHLLIGKDSMIRTLGRKTGMLLGIRKYTDRKTLASIGEAVINSTIAYGAAIWGKTSQDTVGKIQKMQTRLARIVTKEKHTPGTRIKEHRQKTLEIAKWQNVNQIIKTATLNTVIKSINKQTSHDLNQIFTKEIPKHPRGIPAIRITTNIPRTRKGNGFTKRATKDFNDLPPTVRDKNLTPNQMKTKIKSHLNSMMQLKEH